MTGARRDDTTAKLHRAMAGLGLLVTLAIPGRPAAAAWVNLTPRQIEEALAHGQATFEAWRAAGRAIDELDPEYVVDLGPDVGRALLFTEFSTLALEARRWKAIAKPLTPEDVERILLPIRGHLQFHVVVVGPARDYLRSHVVRLEQDGTTHGPLRWDVFHGEQVEGGRGRWVAPGYYTFATDGLRPDAPVTLVLRDQTGHEIRFTFDLARLR
jgi:hypothetical protein